LAIVIQLFEPQRDKHPHVQPKIARERHDFIVELFKLSSLLSELSSVSRQVIADRTARHLIIAPGRSDRVQHLPKARLVFSKAASSRACNALPNQCSGGAMICPGSFNGVAVEPSYSRNLSPNRYNLPAFRVGRGLSRDTSPSCRQAPHKCP